MVDRPACKVDSRCVVADGDILAIVREVRGVQEAKRADRQLAAPESRVIEGAASFLGTKRGAVSRDGELADSAEERRCEHRPRSSVVGSAVAGQHKRETVGSRRDY